jgi:NodT family efflux transporter outer membrane factor (OMF) lipoprotein
MRGREKAFVAIALTALLVSGCSLAPDYQVPDIPVPTSYKTVGIWAPATPLDVIPQNAWWTLYGDAVLDALENKIEPANPSLARAAANYDMAQGFLAEDRSGLFPSLDIGGHAFRERQSDDRPLRSANQPTYYGDNLAGASVSWDLDLWGRIRNEVAAGHAEAQSAYADLAAVRLSLHAQLADDYIALRGLDAEQQLLSNTLVVYKKALDITNARHDKGVASGLDVNRAKTQYEDAATESQDVFARRALLEHAIASLVGTPAPAFAISVSVAQLKIPNVPLGLPSALLQRRPDIAAAERMVAATNAQIGVARAAFYPDISLSALAGFQNAGAGSLLTAPNSFWSLGPSLALNLFDAGRHEGALDVAKAANSGAAADYRATVLHAFQEVEDNLTLLGRLANEADAKAISVNAAVRTQELTLSLYKSGTLGYLDVVVAQTTALQAQEAALAIESRRLQASVGLIQATGGGWSAEEIAGVSPHGSATPRGQL